VIISKLKGGLRVADNVRAVGAVRITKNKLDMKAEEILRRIGYDNDSITSTEKWIAETVYKLAMDDAASLRQPLVSGSLPPVDNRVMFADYIQRCVIERGAMTYPSLQDAIKVWDETTERFSGNDR
jgi:hypothetical protein